MTSLIDSKAAFSARAEEVGLNNPVITALKGCGVETMSQFAFASQPPGQPIVEAQLIEYMNAALGTPIEKVQLMACKRLLFECHTLIMHSLKERVEQSDHTPVRKLNIAERESRQKAQAARLAGVRLKGELEVAHCVIDQVNNQIENRQLKYLPPHKCIKREDEILGAKPPQLLSLDSQGISVKQQDIHLQCDVSSELLAWHAMQRRALAYDLCQVLSYAVAMEWIHYLFDHLHRAAAPGYQWPDLAAILRADRQAWLLLAEEVTTFAVLPDNSMALDKRLLELKMHPEVAFHLLPRPASVKRTADGDPKTTTTTPSTPSYKPKGGGKNRKGTGKGKKGTKNALRTPPMPRELLGHAHLTKTGEPICFDFNMVHGCTKAKNGQKCPKGAHVCCRKGCGKPHSLSDHKD